MKHRNEMDKLLRQRLHHVEMPVPEAMWGQIALARKQRKGYFSGWAGFIGLVLFVVLIASYLTFNELQSTPAAPVLPPPEAPAFPSTYLDESHELADRPVHDAHTELNSGKEFTRTDNSKSILSNEPAIAGNTQKPTSANDSKVTSMLADNSLAQTGQSRVESGLTGKLTGQVEAEQVNSPAASLETQRLITAGVQASPSVHRLHPLLSRVVVGENDAMDLPSVSILQQGRKNGPSCYSFNSYLRGLSFDVYGSPEYAARQLVYKDAGMADYASQRKNMESYSFAYSMGLRANVHFQGGLALRTGMVFTDIVEKFTFNDPDAEITRVIQVNVDTFILGGDIHIVIDTLSIVEFGHREKIGYNSYRFYDVPLILGYEIDRGRWILSLNTGVMLNIATARRGSMLDPDKRLVSINSNEANSYGAFRSRVGTSLIMSLGVNYGITSKLHLLVEPQFRMWMQPLTLKDYPIDQKYVNMGLAFGFRQYL